MTPAQVAERAAALLGAPPTAAHGTVTADVERAAWRDAVRAVRDDPVLDLALFDLLTGVDEAPGVAVLLRLWSPAGRHGLLLRARCPEDDLRLDSLTGLFGGAGWHERSVHEMFGVVFEGHPDLAPLQLPAGFGSHPLRKGTVLASRVVRPWPGAVEPGQSVAEAAARSGRRRVQPPGVPRPGSWPEQP